MAESRAAVLGAAGFLGSHLCERLVAEGLRVVGVDNLITGARANLESLSREPRFEFVEADICDGLDRVGGPLSMVLDLASPASPVDYLRHPFETLRVGSRGVEHALELARRRGAVFLLASTSEVYGDPLEHPQQETYWGNVNPVGPRSVYDESKRFAEAITTTYARHRGVDVRIARIFNTYGPRMRLEDGRVVPNFVAQALRGQPITVYGDGSQTRSFCYVSDLVDGIWRLMQSAVHDPVNLGNPQEMTLLELAKRVTRLAGSASSIVFQPLPVDDPKIRQPDITRARTLLGWEPRVDVDEGLRQTIEWFRQALD